LSGRAGALAHLQSASLMEAGRVAPYGWPTIAGVPGDMPTTPNTLPVKPGSLGQTATAGASALTLHGPGFVAVGPFDPIIAGQEGAEKVPRNAYVAGNRATIIGRKRVLVAWLPCFAQAVEVATNGGGE
jgi:hypothetical protein